MFTSTEVLVSKWRQTQSFGIEENTSKFCKLRRHRSLTVMTIQFRSLFLHGRLLKYKTLGKPFVGLHLEPYHVMATATKRRQGQSLSMCTLG